MVTHGAWPLTERALTALAKHTDVDFEVIVVDNDSRDETRARLAELTSLRVLLNHDNRGFGPATNQAAEHARGEYLLLLNTDAFVHAGWWEPMLATLREPGVGAVVPRLLHADGSLQDAGALLACDGTVRIYGDGEDPNALPYRFRRVIDYGAAACLLIRRATFAQLGGFDSSYAPAYYEDTDFGFRLAQSGLRVVYEPRSTVTHLRYGSGSVDSAHNLSVMNRRRFVASWRPQLTGRPQTFRGASTQAVIAARDAPAHPRFLVCLGTDDPGARQFVEGLIAEWPTARVTWRSHEPDVDRWLRRGVEIVAGVGWNWLDDRLFHYDAIVTAPEVDDALSHALHRTQPQAARISIADIPRWPRSGPADLASTLASAGVAPGASSSAGMTHPADHGDGGSSRS